MELFDKLDEKNNGHIKLETFIAGVHFQQKHMTNVTSTPPPAVGWAPKMVIVNPYVSIIARVLYSGKVWHEECLANLLFLSIWRKKFVE